jgi:N-acetylmuramoyl-L-alanine amidase
MKKWILAFIIFSSSAFAAGAEINKQLYTQEMYPETYCLALNIYHEARSSNRADRIAVSDVVLNRVNDRRYPDSICEVVYQARMRPSWKDPNVMIPVRNQCQFSWYCDGRDDTPGDQDAWIDAQQIAYMMTQLDEFRGITEGATHYHATYVTPPWASTFQLIGRIGEHIFYRH